MAGKALVTLAGLMDSELIFRRMSLPGGPMMMTSSNVKTPPTALTDFDFMTCTSVATELITATLALSVFMSLPSSSFNSREMFWDMRLPETMGTGMLKTMPSVMLSFAVSVALRI
jgi:hypothetical protein